MTNILFSLIRNELWQEKLSVDIKKENIGKILTEAKKQTVIGIAINALIRNNIEMERATVLKAVAPFPSGEGWGEAFMYFCPIPPVLLSYVHLYSCLFCIGGS